MVKVAESVTEAARLLSFSLLGKGFAVYALGALDHRDLRWTAVQPSHMPSSSSLSRSLRATALLLPWHVAVEVLTFCSPVVVSLALFPFSPFVVSGVYAGEWTIRDAYSLIEADPQIKEMAYNNCRIWRSRNARQGLSYYADGYALGAQVSSGVPLDKAVAIGVAAQMWTKKYCPDVW